MESTAGTEFLTSIKNVLQEAQEKGFNSSKEFHKVTGHILKFLRECKRTTGARARASCPISLPDGSLPKACMALPPQGLNLNRQTNKRLREADTATEFCGILLSAIHDELHAKRSQLSKPPNIRRNMTASTAARRLFSKKKTKLKRSPESTPEWSPVKRARRRNAHKTHHVSVVKEHENEVSNAVLDEDAESRMQMSPTKGTRGGVCGQTQIDCVLRGQTEDKTDEGEASLPTELWTQTPQLGTISEEHPNTDNIFGGGQDPFAPLKPDAESLNIELAPLHQSPMKLPTHEMSSPEYDSHDDTSSDSGEISFETSSEASDHGSPMEIDSPENLALEQEEKRKAENALRVRKIMNIK